MTYNCNPQGYPKQLVVMKDCHCSNNEYIIVYSSPEEWGVRLQAKVMNWLVGVSKRIVGNSKVQAA